jgi:hypothetical protein
MAPAELRAALRAGEEVAEATIPVTTVRTTAARLERLASVAESGNVRWVPATHGPSPHTNRR